MARRRRNQLGGIDAIWWVLGAAVVGGGVYLLATQSSGPGLVQQVALDPTQTNQTVSVSKTPGTLNVSLPMGYSWSPSNASPLPTSGAGGASIPWNGSSLTMTFNYLNLSGTEQQQTVSFVANATG